MVNRDAIARTWPLIRPYIRRTPTVEVDGADFGLDGVTLVLKLELLQHSGSFKARGAFANLLLRQVPPAGVVAASGGNHGAAQSGALPVHAYEQVETLLGQGTVGLEFEQQDPALDCVLVAVGGGGLIGGIAAWYGGRTKVAGVEPELAPTLHRALAAGHPVDAPAGGIAADSLAPRRVGELMFPIAQAHVSGVVLVPDEAIAAAQAALWRVLRVVAEPGGAAALAAVISGRYRASRGERVGVLVCGANTTAVSFA